MHRAFRWLPILLITLACTVILLLQTLHPATTRPIPNAVDRVATTQPTDFAQHFRDLGVEGSLLIYDRAHDRVYQHNPQRNATAFLPASTFKILNSLIALETGVIANDIQVLTWDGVPRKLPEWNRDLNMRTALKLSAYWFYQVLARRVGHDRMQQWVSRVGYGNQTIGGPEAIDHFWLRGKLRITPQEQIQFLQRLYTNDLPFSPAAIALVKDMMILEQTPDYTIRGKTGWVGFDDNTRPQIGWVVGYLERSQNAYFFAVNIDIHQPSDATARLELARRGLKDLGGL